MILQKVSQKITPFAWISFVHEEVNKYGLSKLIDNDLGVKNTTVYQYGELFRTWFEVLFCGGEVEEDVKIHLRYTLENILSIKVASPETLLRVLSELATENTIVTSTSGKEYQFNINEKMNDLKIKSLLLTKQLKKDVVYDFDYDNQIIKHEKCDANANVKIAQDKTLERAYELLHENDIKINRFRMDADSYAKDIIDMVSKHSRLFYIRANRFESILEQICYIDDWKKVEINFIYYEVASIPFRQFFEDRNYWLIIMREKSNNAHIDLFTGDNLIYRSILTNDKESSD